MVTRTRNTFDVLRENAAKAASASDPQQANAGASVGQVAAQGTPLTFLADDNATPQIYFRWGRDDFDNPNALFF